MSQNEENNKIEETVVKNPFWSKSSTRLVILALILGYFFFWIPRQECSSKVNYNPAGYRYNSYLSNSSSEGYYFLSNSHKNKFKTKNEAISHCLSVR